MPGGVAAGATDDHARRHLVLVLERPQLAAVLVQEPLGRLPKRVRERSGGMEVWEKSGDLPELDLGGRHVDPQVRTQPFLHPVDEQPADVVHVHVGQHHVGHGRKIDAGGLQSLDQLPGPRCKSGNSTPEPGVDEDGLVAAAHHDHVQRPVERVRRQEHVVQPGRPDGRVGVVWPTLAVGSDSTPSLTTSTSISPICQRVARRNQLVGLGSAGV